MKYLHVGYKKGLKGMASVQIRYIVDDVDAAISFYCGHFKFKEVMHPAPAFAMLDLAELRLVLSKPNPSAGGGQAMPDDSPQKPRGWNRFAIQVKDLPAVVANLKSQASIVGTRLSAG